MTRPSDCRLSFLVLAIAAACTGARAADEDALDLQAAAPQPARKTDAPEHRLTLELAAIQGQVQPGNGSRDGHRASLDWRFARAFGDGWRLGVSDRLDDLHPVQPGQRSTRNSLREAFVGWQTANGNTSVDAGRINLRNGPAYGYNPTDYFRTGATRTVVTADPVAIRENRVGSFMLRGSQLWDGGGASLAWSPRLTRQGLSAQGWTLDLAATNAQDRWLATVNQRFNPRWSGQALVLLDREASTRIGANLTGLLSDAAVFHAEWSSARSLSLLEQAIGQPANKQRRDQASAGITYSLPGGLAITAEAAYNGAGLNQTDFNRLFAQSATTVGQFFGSQQASQELSARRAWLLYATQKGAFTKQLDITAFVRQNAVDHSHLMWAEARYHWPRFDAALQWQGSSRRIGSEFGSLPYHQVVQLAGFLYF